MIAHKRIGLVLAATLVVSLLSFLFISYNVGKTEASSTKLTARILRRADRRNEKLNAAELDFLRKNSQEEKVEEREFKDEIPKHVPLRAKIRKEKEKEFKDLKNERWARDFELEVTNNGDRPIYWLDLILIMDIKAASGKRIVAPLYYGRTELGTVGEKATTDDIPIKPGESIILKIHPGQLDAWDILQKRENRPYPKSVRVVFQGLNFGDGTGLFGSGGDALPRKPGTTSQGCVPQKNKSGPTLAETAPSRDEQGSSKGLPARFLPVNFLVRASYISQSSESELEPDDCCGGSCSPLIPHTFSVLRMPESTKTYSSVL